MSTDWRTPPEMLAPVRAYFGGRIPFDAATTADNPTGADAFATPGDDGLARPWPPHVWVNPPYGRELRRWLGKIAREAGRGVEVVALLPTARFEMRAMQVAFAAANAVCWVRRRVTFIRAATGERGPCPTYASMFVAWNVDPRPRPCSVCGQVIDAVRPGGRARRGGVRPGGVSRGVVTMRAERRRRPDSRARTSDATARRTA